MNKWAKIAFGLSLLWYGVLRGAKGLVVRISDYSFGGVNLSDGTVVLNLNVSIKNPLIVGLKIKSIVGEVFAQGTKVGTINTTYDYYLAGGHTHVIPVYVNLSMGSTLNAALNNINSGTNGAITIAFDGKIYVGDMNIGIPLQFETQYDGLLA